MLFCSSLSQLIHRRNTQGSLCQCLNYSSGTLCPKAFQPGVERMLFDLLLWYRPVSQENTMSVTEHFCHCDNPAFPCSRVDCWLCSCFPSRSGAPDDGRPRYGLCSFSTLLSVSSCFVAASAPSLQRMGQCLQIIWLQIKHILWFTFFFFSCVILFICRFDFWFAPLTFFFVFVHSLHCDIWK